jgi:hypothetical protein
MRPAHRSTAFASMRLNRLPAALDDQPLCVGQLLELPIERLVLGTPAVEEYVPGVDVMPPVHGDETARIVGVAVEAGVDIAVSTREQVRPGAVRIVRGEEGLEESRSSRRGVTNFRPKGQVLPAESHVSSRRSVGCLRQRVPLPGGVRQLTSSGMDERASTDHLRCRPGAKTRSRRARTDVSAGECRRARTSAARDSALP